MTKFGSGGAAQSPPAPPSAPAHPPANGSPSGAHSTAATQPGVALPRPCSDALSNGTHRGATAAVTPVPAPAGNAGETLPRTQPSVAATAAPTADPAAGAAQHAQHASSQGGSRRERTLQAVPAPAALSPCGHPAPAVTPRKVVAHQELEPPASGAPTTIVCLLSIPTPLECRYMTSIL